MKKILWLSHMIPYPPKGGNLQRSYNLIRELSKYHEITIIAFNQSKILDSQEKIDSATVHFSTFCKVKQVFEIPSESGFFSRLVLLIKALLPWRTYTVSWLESEEFKKFIDDTMQETQFDLLYADTISLAQYIAHKKDVKKVLNHHNIESQMLLRRVGNEKNWLKKLYFQWEGIKLENYERATCKNFDLNVTCSEIDTARLLKIAGKLNVESVPNGVDLDYFIPVKGIDIKPKSLVFAGGLTWYPNLDAMTFFLKNVWPSLSQQISGISMTVIGRSPPQWMINLQEQYSNLHITGFVDDVRPYLTEAEIYVCPIKDGGGTKLKILDALAMGKPLIADPIACEGINVENEKNVLFASTADEYIRSIKTLLLDNESKTQMSLQSKKLIIEQYSFVSIGKDLANHFERIISGNG